METLMELIGTVRQYLEIPILKLGGAPVTLWAIIQLVVLVALLFYLSGKLRTWIVEQFLTRTRMELGARQATGSIIRYTIIAIGFIVIPQIGRAHV